MDSLVFVCIYARIWECKQGHNKIQGNPGQRSAVQRGLLN